MEPRSHEDTKRHLPAGAASCLRGFVFLSLLLTLACNGEPPPRVGVVADDRINEASGVIASRAHPGVFWTHNDGNDGVLYAMDRSGALIGCGKVDAKIKDWEDI